MAEKSARRGVSIYIDGQQVENSVKAITSELRKVVNEQKKAEIGSEEYVKAGKKIAQLKAHLAEHHKLQQQISKEYVTMQKKSSSFLKTISGGLMVFAGNLMTKAFSGLTRALSDGVEKIRSFEKANAVLASVLGKNVREIKALSTSAIELGKDSKYTASQVTELQTELAKLGFNDREIQQSQKHILNFATALNADLSSAASLAGASLRSFGADTTETERYVSAMTIATNRSALSFEALSTALPIVSPVASALNLTIEDTLALLGKLADSGFNASTSATSLRNIFLNLSNGSGKLATALGKPVNSLEDLVEGFQKLSEKGISLGEALELTDKQSVAAFQTFLKGSDSVLTLRDSLIDVGDELQKIADDQMNTLDGSILSLQSSWEALMLAFSNSSGVMKTVVDYLTSFVDWLTKAVEVAENLRTGAVYKNFMKGIYDDYLEELDKRISEKQEEGYDIEFILQVETAEAERSLAEYQDQIEKFQANVQGAINAGIIKEMSEKDQKELKKLQDSAEVVAEYIKGIQELRKKYLGKEEPVTTSTGTGSSTVSADKSAEQRKQVSTAIRKVEEEHLKEMSAIKQRYLNGDIQSEYEYNQEIRKQQDTYDAERKKKLQELLDGSKEVKKITDETLRIDLAKQIANVDNSYLDRQITQVNKIKKILLDADPLEAEKQSYENRLRELGLFNVRQEDMTLEQKKALELLEKQHQENIQKISTREAALELKRLDTQQAEAERRLNERRVHEKMTEQKYKDELLQLELDYLNKRLEINGLSAAKIEEINKQIQQVQMDQFNSKADARLVALDRFNLVSLEDNKQMELDIIQYYEDQGILSHEEAIKARRAIDDEYLDGLTSKVSEVSDKVQIITSNLSGSFNNFLSAQETAIATRYDKEIAAAQGNSKKQARLEKEKQEELNAIRAEYADKQFAVSVAQIIATTSVAAMEAYKAMAGIPIVGPVLGAAAAAATITYGASQIKVAKEQRNAAKEGYFKGGYTGGSSPYEVRGHASDGLPIHGQEFVANHQSTANPEIKPFLDVLDEAQQHGTASSLTKKDIAKAIRLPVGGYYNGGYTKPSPALPEKKTPEENPVLDKLTDVLDRLEDRLNYPFESKVSITGKDGLEEKSNLYDKMMNNVRRSIS